MVALDHVPRIFMFLLHCASYINTVYYGVAAQCAEVVLGDGLFQLVVKLWLVAPVRMQ